MIRIDPDLRLVTAPNPGPMTGTGTNSYLLGRGDVVLIDPGPDLPAHQAALLQALDPGERIAAVLVTHSHRDHTALVPSIVAATGAPVLGAGRAGSGRSDRMQGLSGLAGGEGFDHSYAPDRVLGQGEVVQVGTVTVEVLATPGHTGCHLSFACDGRLFSGDMVMGWSTSLVSPPDGDMSDYMASLVKLAARPWRVIHPGHGPVVSAPADRLAELLAHRKGREAEILAALAHLGQATAGGIAARVYTDIPAALLPVAERNVLAHLIDLAGRGQIGIADRAETGWLFEKV